MGLLQNHLVAWVLTAVMIAAGIAVGRSADRDREPGETTGNLQEIVQVVDELEDN